MRAIVFRDAGGREVMRLEERPDPMPGNDELLVAARFAGINTGDLAQRAGAYPAPPGAPQDVRGMEVAGTVVVTGAAVRDVRGVTAFSASTRAAGSRTASSCTSAT
jgi:NADPH:quinone reductase